MSSLVIEIKEQMPNNVILLHCHIFKNGGSTIDNALTNNFGTRAIFRENPAGQQFLLSDTIIDIVESAGPAEVASVSSHRMGLPAPRHNSIKFIPLIMIREPLDRLGSMYSFYGRQKNYISHECLLAKRETLKSFIETLLSAGLDSSFSNLQCQFFLGNYSPPQHPSEKTWPTIVNNLHAVSCVGLLEMFDESMVIWEEYLRQFIPDINLSYVKKNVSANRPPTLEERLELIREQLGDDLVAEFTKQNQYDYQLYNLAKIKLRKVIEEQPSFHERLAGFRKKHPHSKTIPHTLAGEGQVVGEANDNSSSSAEIIACELLEQETGQLLKTVRHGQHVKVLIAVEVKKEISSPIVGITVTNDKGDIVFAMNSLYTSEGIPSLASNKKMTFGFCFTIPPLNSGSYAITPALASGTQEEHTPLSRVEDAVLFLVPKMIDQRMPGFLYLENYSVEKQEVSGWE